ncbi:MAG: hypothetical protein KatS3mg081_1749 [Gemmatimonadales bacterium]|nr:MAG: hypothetical protein KatS3mg081_1749 [Gemmatimonadales bacterium]
MKRFEGTILGPLLGAALACGGSKPPPQAAPLPVPPAETAAAEPAVPEDAALAGLSGDSAADLAALEALHQLEFGSLAKGASHVRGVLPVASLARVQSDEVNDEAARMFGATRGGAASAGGPVYDIDVESFATRSQVQYYVNFFLTEARDRFEIWLGRLNRYEGMIRSRFRQYGIPEDLVYLALIESGYSNTAVSRAQAVGMWQFIASTGRKYGLQIDDWVDERRDPFKATDAAARHLVDLYEMFGSWYLAAAAYNGGAGRVTRGLQRLPGTQGEISDETFFDLSDRRYLRRETRDYVPKLIAAALIAKEPERYGFQNVQPLEPLVFDEITVPDQTGLDVLAKLADTTTQALLELNPQYYRGVTPPGRSSVVRVPRGTGTIVAKKYAELPPSERVTFLEHVIRRGETLSEIGRRYGVTVRQLQAANPGVHPLRLRIGARLVIPISRGARARTNASAPSRRVESQKVPPGTYHVVQRGETLWILSQRYGVTIADLRRWNGLRVDDILRVGQRLLVAPPASSGEPQPSR